MNINLKTKYEDHVPENIKQVINICSHAADEISMPIFLIGGAVRDIILDRDIFDTDITVQGSAIEFAKYLTSKQPAVCILKETHERFNTAKVEFHIDGIVLDLDLASTRIETYEQPASLPTLTEIGCSIEKDINRRDFTINSMGLSLNQKSFCDLIDPLNGLKDLENKKLRVIHPISFIDDPTRIIRALKFRVRFGFELDENTKQLQKDALNKDLFQGLGTERIKLELKQTFNLNNAQCFNFFVQETIYKLISKEIEQHSQQLPTGERVKQSINQLLDSDNKYSIWMVYLGALAFLLEGQEQIYLAARLNLNKNETSLLQSLSGFNHKDLDCALKNSEIYNLLKQYSVEALAVFHVFSNSTNQQKIENYVKNLSRVEIYTNGADLINMGIKKGPVFKKILDSILSAKLDNIIQTQKDEIEFIKKYIE